MIESALVKLLLADPAVSSLVGNRIRPLVLPQDEILPALTYQSISGVSAHGHSGKTGKEICRMQFDCYAPGYSTAKNVSKALCNALDGFRGLSDGILIEGIFKENELDDFEEGLKIYRVILDFIIHY